MSELQLEREVIYVYILWPEDLLGAKKRDHKLVLLSMMIMRLFWPLLDLFLAE